MVDHGPGIPDDEKDRVFERFTQIDQSDTRSKGGTGLGLSIVKSLAEVMYGAVRVEATEGGGATFVVELPLAPALSRRRAARTRGSAPVAMAWNPPST